MLFGIIAGMMMNSFRHFRGPLAYGILSVTLGGIATFLNGESEMGFWLLNSAQVAGLSLFIHFVWSLALKQKTQVKTTDSLDR